MATAEKVSPAVDLAAANGWLAGVSAEEMLREATAYPHATAHVPAWVRARVRGHKGAAAEAASTLFLPPAHGTALEDRPTMPGATVPWSCMPELLTKGAAFHPAFNGEVKSAMSSGEGSRLHMFDEVATYAVLGMLGSYFLDVPAGSHRFFRAPPHAFSLVAMAHVGYLVAVEWVGKVFISAVSEPFFLDSERHRAAIGLLPDSDMSGGAVDMPVAKVPVAAWPPAPTSADDKWQAGVIWRTQAPAGAGEGSFFKIIRGHAYTEAVFRRMFKSYAALAAARADTLDPPPVAIAVSASAELLFGAGEVCVQMPWIAGRAAARGDLTASGCAVEPVAAALAWLARHCLLYVDVRGPNVLIEHVRGEAPRVALVDFDDMVVTDRPPASADELIAFLARAGALFVSPEGMPGALPALVAALRAAWR